MDLLFPRFYAITFNFSSPLKANKANAMTANYWGDNEPLDGNDCVVLSGALWKSKSCNSKNLFVCVGKNNIYYHSKTR